MPFYVCVRPCFMWTRARKTRLYYCKEHNASRPDHETHVLQQRVGCARSRDVY